MDNRDVHFAGAEDTPIKEKQDQGGTFLPRSLCLLSWQHRSPQTFLHDIGLNDHITCGVLCLQGGRRKLHMLTPLEKALTLS